MSEPVVWDAETPPNGTVRDWLDHRADTDGASFAYSFPDQQAGPLNWQDLRDCAREIARDLTERGLGQGASVAILTPNGYDAILCVFGALYGGFRILPINLVAGDAAVRFALDHSEAQVAFVAPEAQELFDRCAPDGLKQLPLPRGPVTDRTTALHDITATDDALLMYTSGTTGQPKGVVHSHASLLAGGWTATVAHALTPQDKGLCVLPIYHINGLCVTVMGTLVSGGALAVAEKFSASRFWAQAGAEKITWFSVVPTIISHLLHGNVTPDDTTRARLRFGRSASAALAVETQTAFEARFDVPIIETMGLTETAAQILSNPLPPGIRKIGSPGVAYGNTAKILGPNGEAPRDTEGEIAVRGPNVMRGYLKNPEATAKTFDGDWLLTGDLGRMDADGYVYVTGRLKELIIKGGENIAPREIDEALYTHPDVIEAAAFARPCARYGETVEAAVRLRDGSHLGADELIALCVNHVGKFKSPDTVHLLDDLPKGPSGKIQRLKLADLIPV